MGGWSCHQLPTKRRTDVRGLMKEGGERDKASASVSLGWGGVNPSSSRSMIAIETIENPSRPAWQEAKMRRQSLSRQFRLRRAQLVWPILSFGIGRFCQLSLRPVWALASSPTLGLRPGPRRWAEPLPGTVKGPDPLCRSRKGVLVRREGWRIGLSTLPTHHQESCNPQQKQPEKSMTCHTLTTSRPPAGTADQELSASTLALHVCGGRTGAQSPPRGPLASECWHRRLPRRRLMEPHQRQPTTQPPKLVWSQGAADWRGGFADETR